MLQYSWIVVAVGEMVEDGLILSSRSEKNSLCLVW